MLTVRAIRWGLLLVIFGLSAGVLAQEPEAPVIPVAGEAVAEVPRAMAVSGLGEWALAKAYSERAVWLNLEDDTRALALFQAELSTPGRGALIVLADEGQTAAEGILGSLLQALAERGVAVMTLGLRSPPEGLRRSRQQALALAPAAQEPEAADEASVMIDVADEGQRAEGATDYRAGVRYALNAAIQELERREYERIAVAGVGWSAEYVTDWALGRDALAGVVWLAPRFSAEQRANLPGLLEGERRWQVLDLHASSADREGLERAAAIGRQAVAGYQRQPLAFANPPQSADAERVASRISSWLGREAFR